MYLIESKTSDGKLCRHHWISVQKKWTREKANEAAEKMAATFGAEWTHSVRPVTAEEIGFAQRQGWL